MGISTTFVTGRRIKAAELNAKPYVHAYQTTTVTLVNNTWTELSMQAEVVDSINGHSTVTNPARYTPSVAGVYKVTAQVAYAGNTAGDRGAQARKNGGVVIGAGYGSSRSLASGANFAATPQFHGTISMNGTTDYISLWANQTSGGNLDTFADVNFTNSFWIIEWKCPL